MQEYKSIVVIESINADCNIYCVSIICDVYPKDSFVFCVLNSCVASRICPCIVLNVCENRCRYILCLILLKLWEIVSFSMLLYWQYFSNFLIKIICIIIITFKKKIILKISTTILSP
jgi:hypothetical protein